MKAHSLTGEQAYNLGKHSPLYQCHAIDVYELLKFEAYDADGIIIARDERDCAVIFKEARIYTLYTKK